jgi:hypothetical protein
VQVEDALDDRQPQEAGDLAQSEMCLIQCGRYSGYSAVRLRAANQVIDVYSGDSTADGRRLALQMLAHKWLADSLWKSDPQGRLDHLLQSASAARHDVMWSYVRSENNGFPANDGYFQRIAEETVTDALLVQQAVRAGASVSGTSPVPFECEIEKARASERLCEKAQARWDQSVIKNAQQNAPQ